MADQIAKVLVVDDEEDIRVLLYDALSRENVRVATASSGNEAVDMARSDPPDVLVADLCLSDCTGLEVIDRCRRIAGDLPAVVITGRTDKAGLAEAFIAGNRRSVELLTKPLDLDRLQAVVDRELARLDEHRRRRIRADRLRTLAHDANRQRKIMRKHLNITCADLATAYRNLSEQIAVQQTVLGYQNELLAAGNDDDVFRCFFTLFARRLGTVHGVALVCDAQAQLRIIGRFGVPQPDALAFCKHLAEPMIDDALAGPSCGVIDAGDRPERFDETIRRYLAGLSILTVPLLPAPGEMIGLVLLYLKGEQPFSREDIALAHLLAKPTATAIRRND